jgi:MFS family permease
MIVCMYIVVAFDGEIAKEGWKPIFSPTPSVRRMLLAGVGLGACQQLNGSEAFIYFSPVLLEDAGFETKGQTFGITLCIGFCKTSAIAIGAYLVDSWGRRPLLFLSTGLMAFFLLLLAVSFPGGDNDEMRDVKIPICIFAMCAFVASFSVGVGPVTWAGASEVFPLHIRAKALSLATSSNRLVSATVAGTTLTLRNAFGVSGFFVFYACMTVVSACYLYKFFPETKGLSLEEVTALFDDPNDKEYKSSSSDGKGNVSRTGTTTSSDKPNFETMAIETENSTL